MDELDRNLDPQEAISVTQLLECIVDHQDDYQNLVRFAAGDGKLRLMPALRNTPVKHRLGPFYGSRALLTKLELMGWIQFDAPPPVRATKRGISGGNPNAFFFTARARDAYRMRNHVTDEQIRKVTGEHLYELYQGNDDNFLEPSIDTIMHQTGVERARVISQLRLLRDTGIIQDIAPVGAAEFGLVGLTSQGLQWVINGFPKDLALPPPVNVTVQIDISNLLRDIANADAPDQQKEEFATLVKELQREPTTEKVSRLFGLAASIQQLTPSVMRFIQENGPALMNYLPN